MKYLDARTFLVIAALIAVLGFLFIHSYGNAGVLWYVMHGKIYITPECPDYETAKRFGLLVVDVPNCGHVIAYKWVLAAGVLVAGAALLIKRERR